MRGIGRRNMTLPLLQGHLPLVPHGRRGNVAGQQVRFHEAEDAIFGPRQEVGRTPPRINNYLTLAIFVPFQQVKQELEEVYSYLYEETVKQSIGSYEIVWSLEEQ